MTSATYAPQGGLASLTNGAAIYGAFSYNTRLQPLQIFYGTNTPPALTGSTCPGTVGNIMHRVYNFGLGSNDNGNVDSIANCRDTTRTATFTYDTLNRIKTAQSSGSGTTSWGEDYSSGIDPWGNLTNINPISGKQNHEGLTCASANTKNQLNTCFSYDAAGNLWQNGAYTYDAENRLTALSSPVWYYVYDGDGNRVEKCTSSTCPSNGTGTAYWRTTAGATISEGGLNGTVNHEYIFFDGQRVARRDIAGNSVHYYFSDHLGTHAVVMNATGTQCEQDADYYPYGGVQNDYCTTQVAQNYKLTGKERDAESGLDNFGARYDASSLGRFMTPDPLGGRLVNPQTLNKYSYVANNPINFTDPTGLYMCKDSKDCSSAADVKFEKTLDALRNSSDADVARGAGAYGAANADNGVTVGFADLSTKGENGSTVSTIGSDSQGNLRANSDVTINSKINGDSYAGAIGHEGSHAADAQDVVKSGITGGLLAGQPIYAGMDITHYQSEVRAWGVTQSILKSGNFTQAFDCGTANCTLGANVAIGNDKKLPAQLGEVFDKILANQKIYNQGGKPMGPGNQGPNIVNGVSLTPKVSLPH